MSLINLVDSFSSRISSMKSSGYEGNSVGKNESHDSGADKRDNPGIDEVKSVVKELNRMSSMFNDNIIRFTLDENTKRIIVKVIDSETEEVVRQIPAKHSIRLLEHFKEQMGVLIDKSI